MLTETAQLGLDMRFEVDIDGFALGSWSSCKGLKVTFGNKRTKELGDHATTHIIPTHATYSNVVLQRAIERDDWNKTKQWLTVAAFAPWMGDEASPLPSGVPIGPSTATITLRDGSLEEVATWTLEQVQPASWSGPSLSSTGKGVAIETLELAHEGFLS